MNDVRTVGDLRAALANVSDDTPIALQLDAPRSARPSSMEDEYGPGFVHRRVVVQASGHPAGGVVLHVGGDAYVAVTT